MYGFRRICGSELLAGEFAPGDRLPTREELSAEYEVAPGVTMQAPAEIRERLRPGEPPASG
ncbi:GntR family transcriptional regulator [Nonomuraea sp. KC401]|uniref:GntR family transcriptional regulator n=1 Tax=unclassified Nonomuraea TaxID=2593643 RepID=UPI0010FDFF20|nr:MULTISPECIES: GntR family transcriptional regulator [unclassified Nonomuraea]NBE96988.1 GntR family transcriptional regulator [Nonomuraea sp. K271]TLF66263.1 GntR family transcriptional regulator [Nonomuraea sp. KC401]